MKTPATAIVIATFLLLVVALGVAGANLLGALQTALNPTGEVYELNLDPDDNLIISEWGEDEIWQLNPATNVYTIYLNTSDASDANIDSNGDIWWTQPDNDKVGQYSVATDEIATWSFPFDSDLLGLAIDEEDRIWINSDSSTVYRIDMSSTQLCTYTFASSSEYILFDNGDIWVADNDSDSFTRVNTANNQTRQWPLELDSFNPGGMDIDDQGRLWWADQGFHGLGSLDPAIDQVTVYTLPIGTYPQMVSVAADGVWYSEQGIDSAGLLDPAVATGITSTLTASNSSETPVCDTLDTGDIVSSSTITGTASWIGVTMDVVYDVGGWKVYELPEGSLPWGITTLNGTAFVADQGRQQLVAIEPDAPINSNFSGSPVDGIAPLTVNFTNHSSGDYSDCLWEFGDGSDSIVCADPSHEYLNSGTYSVTLIVSGTSGIDSLTRANYITVYEPVTADFSATPTSGLDPLTVTFTNLSSGNYDTCAWEFGDGGNSSDCDDQDHEYISAGVYSVTLTVSGSGGLDALTRNNYITVTQHVGADFSATPTSGPDPLSVAFSNLSVGDIDSCAWDFGDGGSSAQCSDPGYEYTSAGVYTVILSVSGPVGTDTITRTNYITVYQHVEAGFSATPTSGPDPLTVSFTNLSSGAYDTCDWEFGDGDNSSDCDDQDHEYISAGVYSVTLTVSGSGGLDALTRNNYITVTQHVGADFSATPTSGPDPLTVAFSNLSVGDIDSCAWDFGDSGTSTQCNDPEYEYTSAGVFTVSLSVSGPLGTDTITRSNYITVYQHVEAGFSATPTSGPDPLTVTFSNLSTGAYDTCDWEFGDGDSSSDCDGPDHEYISPGVYSVTLSVTGLGGTDALTRTNYITVYQHVEADFSAAPLSGGDPLTVTFSNLSTGEYDSCAWDFGDGEISSECEDPTHNYMNTGVYTVTLTVTGLGGSDTKTRVGYISVGSYQLYLPLLLNNT